MDKADFVVLNVFKKVHALISTRTSIDSLIGYKQGLFIRFDILINPEKIIGIVLSFDFYQPVIIVPVTRLYHRKNRGVRLPSNLYTNW